MRVVVKIGSSSLVDADGTLRESVFGSVARQVAGLRDAGHDVLVVSSGAIAAGIGVLGRTRRPRELPGLQAASAVGQGALYARWSTQLAQHGTASAQVLLTMHDVVHRASYVNARNTLTTLLGWGVVPVINENDTTATDEITFGDNDALAAQVAVLVGADLLVLLTDAEGLFTCHPSDPGAELIRRVEDMTLLTRIDTATPGSHWGSGGMRSKVVAAEMAVGAGAEACIASAQAAAVLERIVAGDEVGTRFVAGRKRWSAFRLWLRYCRPPSGAVVIDDGAWRAVRDEGASLLPVGITHIVGEWAPGDAVDIRTSNSDEGEAVARGIASLSSTELAALLEERGRGTGVAVRHRAAIHRDELAVF